MSTSPPETNRLFAAPTVILRLLNGDPTIKKEVLHGVTNTETGFNFHGSINRADSCIEEHLNVLNQPVFLRFRYIGDPPPCLPKNIYNEVTSLHVSCLTSVKWIFSQFNSMPKLTNVTFGTGSFTEETVADFYRNLKMEKCPAVTHLVIRVDVERFKKLEKADKLVVKLRIEYILDCAKACFPELKDVDLTVPQAVEFKVAEFRNAFAKIEHTATFHKNKEVLTYQARFNRQPSQPAAGTSKPRSNGQSSRGVWKKPKMEPDLIELASDEEGEGTPPPPREGIQESASSPSPPTSSTVSPPSAPPPTPNPQNAPAAVFPSPKTKIHVIGPTNASLPVNAGLSHSHIQPPVVHDPRLLRKAGKEPPLQTANATQPLVKSTVGPRSRFHTPATIGTNSQPPVQAPPRPRAQIPTSAVSRPPIIIPAAQVAGLLRSPPPQAQATDNSPLPQGQPTVNAPRPQAQGTINTPVPQAPATATVNAPRPQAQGTINTPVPQAQPTATANAPRPQAQGTINTPVPQAPATATVNAPRPQAQGTINTPVPVPQVQINAPRPEAQSVNTRTRAQATAAAQRPQLASATTITPRSSGSKAQKPHVSKPSERRDVKRPRPGTSPSIL